MNINVLKTFLFGEFQNAVEVSHMAVNAAGGEQAHKVERSALVQGVVHSGNDSLVVLKLVLVYCFGNSCELLINDSACADVGVTNLAVTHLTVGQTNVHTRSADLSERILGKELVDVRGVCGKNGVSLFLALFAHAEAVKNHK